MDAYPEEERGVMLLYLGQSLGQISEEEGKMQLYQMGYDVFEGKGMPLPDFENIL